ncbi:MAG: helix-turn-helix transcriptional regulator [Leptolyngbya sp. SIO1D8]|nr:helix-turn-helix transcriptional regulator [Leptolyngbya sp. SIO1D8]
MTQSKWGTPQATLDSPQLSSAHLHWPGLILEHCQQPACNLPQCEIAWHTLSMIQGQQGQTRVAVNQQWQRYVAKPGELWLLPACQLSQSQWDGPLEYLRLLIEPQWLMSLATEVMGQRGYYLDLNRQVMDPLVHQILLALHQELMQNSSASHFYAEALGHGLGVHLLKRYARLDNCSPRPNGASAGDFRCVDAYIRAHLSDTIRLADLAHLVHMSPNYFAEQFKQVMGISPYRYVTQCRIQVAQKLLAQRVLSISEVASQVGIHNPSHFARCFRQWTGTSPKAYRAALMP